MNKKENKKQKVFMEDISVEVGEANCRSWRSNRELGILIPNVTHLSVAIFFFFFFNLRLC